MQIVQRKFWNYIIKNKELFKINFFNIKIILFINDKKMDNLYKALV